MNIKTTAILVGLLVVVGLYFFLVELKTERMNPAVEVNKPKAEGEPLYKAEDFPTATADKVTIQTKDGPKLAFAKEGDKWWQTQPVRFPLNKWDISSLIDAAAGLKATDTITPGKGEAPKLADIELDPPAAVVTVTTKIEPKEEKTEPGAQKPEAKTVTYTLKLGKRGAGGDWGYVQKEGEDKVYVVGGGLHSKVMVDAPDAWREKSLEAPTEGKAQRVSLTRDGKTVEVVKSGGDWSFGPPASGRVDTTAVSGLLNGLSAVYINKFYTDAPKDLSIYGLDKPTTVVTVHRAEAPAEKKDEAKKDDAKKDDTKKDETKAEAAEPKVYTLRIGGPADVKAEHFYATYSYGDEPSPVVFDIPKSSVDKFAKNVDDLRDPRITPLKLGDLRELEIDRDGKPVMKLTKSPETGWTFADPAPPFKADTTATGDLLKAVTEAKAASYQADAKPQGDPSATIKLAALGRTEPDVMKVFPTEKTEDKAEPKNWLVVRNNETTGYVVPRDKIEGAFEPAWSLRDRAVHTIAQDKVTQVTLTRSDGQAYTFVYEVPKPEKPADAPKDDKAKPQAEKKKDDAAKKDDAKDDAKKNDAKKDDAKAAGDKGEKKEDEKDKSAKPQAAAPAPVKGAWKLTGQEKFESGAFHVLLGRAALLRAEKWLPQDQGPGDGAAVLTLEVKEGSPVTIRVDPKTRHASSSDVDQPFVVPQTVVDALEGEYLYRTIVPAQMADVTKAVVTDGDQSLTVTRDEDGKYASPDGKELDQSAVGAFFDTLAGLRVKRFEKPGETKAKRTIALTLTEGKTAVGPITLGEKPQGPHTVGDRPFSLDALTYDKLTASLLKKDQKKPEIKD
jgi:Domain of unknown function (DUF4340)